MKPRTKFQKEAVKISASLPALSAAQYKWAKQLLPSFIYSTKKRKVCLDCGYEEKEAFDICPECHAKLSEMNTKARSKKEFDVFQIYTTRGDIQIVRLFYIEKQCKVGEKAFYVVGEIAQYYIDNNGKETVLSRNYNLFSCYATTPSAVWNMYSELSVKSMQSFQRRKPWGYDYPRAKITKSLKQRGFKTDLSVYPMDLIPLLMNNDSIAETLLKAGESEILRAYVYEKRIFAKYLWSAIKICFRQKYKIEDFGFWRDYIMLLEYMGKDIRNPKYICPENLKDAHDWALQQKKGFDKKKEKLRKAEMEQRREQERAEKIKNLELAREKYLQKIAKYKDIVVSDADLRIEVLKTVDDFIKEGEIMKHCVFDSGYYEFEDSLILSARIGDTIIETIEVSLSDHMILQHRGYDNKDTEYGQRIVNIVKTKLFPILRKVA